MQLTYAVVDAFTSKPFGGNPAAVIVLSDAKEHQFDDKTLQLIARCAEAAELALQD
jgi:predicted PhzF superfamily epimerase YddE/YHI9